MTMLITVWYNVYRGEVENVGGIIKWDMISEKDGYLIRLAKDEDVENY